MNIKWDAEKYTSDFSFVHRYGSDVAELIDAALFDRPTELKGENGMEDWIRMFVKTPFNVVPSAREKDEIISRAARELRRKLFINGKWYADYVRLRMKAVRF